MSYKEAAKLLRHILEKADAQGWIMQTILDASETTAIRMGAEVLEELDVEEDDLK